MSLRPFLLALGLWLLLVAPAAARPGDLDAGFGHGGRVKVVAPELANAVVVRPDGGVVLAGWADGETVATLAADGAAESPARRLGAGVTCRNTAAGHLSLDPDGGTWVLGSLCDGSPLGKLTLDHLRADGTASRALVTAPERLIAADVVTDAAGTLVLAATVGSSMEIVRVHPDGTYAFSLGARHAEAAQLVALPGGGVALGGITRAGATVIAWFDAQGRRTAVAHARGMLGGLAASDGLLAANNVKHDTVITRYDARGTVRRRFRRAAMNTAALAVDRRHRLVVAGVRTDTAAAKAMIARYTPTGRPDRRFGQDGVVRPILAHVEGALSTSFATSDVAIAADGKIVVAGTAYDTDVEGTDSPAYGAVARLLG